MGSAVSQPRVRPIAALLATLGLVLVLAACTTSGGASTPPSAATSAAPSAAPSTAVVSAAPSSGGGGYGGNDDYGAPSKAPGASAAASITVEVDSTGAVGAHLTGANGATLYTFKPDPTSTSTCVDACATTWPPLTVAAGGSALPGAGVTGTLTTFARPDGSMQVAYDGRPLYYFAGDASPGDTNGQGRGDAWFVVAP